MAGVEFNSLANHARQKECGLSDEQTCEDVFKSQLAPLYDVLTPDR